ncbi:MAG: DUF3300 domain-containing protein [Proteobacteria bacterium]|nr:DUF3300 domain-containing protein [Pseudomonadota bacterium]MBU1641590.1 DUF3300 domain-containing protein [Pseudomonadota bacterium]
MKAATIFPLALGLFIIFSLAPGLALSPHLALAQDTDYLEASDNYSREELTQMLAPIALYPDALLSQILMASTYPLEVIEAERWITKNPALKGNALDAALLEKDWSPSVKAICHFPTILALMSERVNETTNLGNAFLAQEAEVLDMVQELRAKAYAQGNLTTTAQQKVLVEKETIIIEPADPRVIYVPYYDPLFVFGPWWYPAFPPLYWGPPGIRISRTISYWPSISFGFVFGTWSYFDWHQHSIYIDVHQRPRFVRTEHWLTKPGRWQHDPRHRRGVAFRDKATARKYGQSSPRSRVFQRDTRGFPELPRHDLREDARPSLAPDKRKNNRPAIDRNHQERQRVERERMAQERADRDKQERLRIERDLKERARIDSDRQQRERVEQDSQMRQRAERDRKERAHFESQQQQRQRLELSKPAQGRSAPGQRPDNIFTGVDNGRKEQDSSERGRVSRYGRDSDSRGRERRSNNDDRGDLEGWGRNKK